jgi:hypothetical protein
MTVDMSSVIRDFVLSLRRSFLSVEVVGAGRWVQRVVPVTGWLRSVTTPGWGRRKRDDIRVLKEYPN